MGDRKVVVLYHMLDNSTFFVKTSEGGLLPIRKERRDGVYHVAGEVMVAPRELLTPTLTAMLPALAAGKADLRILLCPLPRYMYTPCCQEEGHCAGLGEEGYPEKMLAGLTEVYKFTKEFVRNGNLRKENVTTLNPVWAMSGGTRSSNSELADMLWEAWETDPIHMNSEGYFKLAAGVMKVVQTQSQPSEQSRKRKREGGESERRDRTDSMESGQSDRYRGQARGGRGYWKWGNPPSTGHRGHRGYRGYRGRRPRSTYW
jgi:hypothetical protein